MKVMGIDPGLKGAVASWDGETLITASIPSVKAASRGTEVDWPQLITVFDVLFLPVNHAFLERVGSRPGQGVASMFKFGGVYEGLRVLLACKEIPTTRVTPGQWKKTLRVGSEKQSAIARASEIFPHSTDMFRGPRGGIIDGVAEAALLAWYGRREMMGKNG